MDEKSITTELTEPFSFATARAWHPSQRDKLHKWATRSGLAVLDQALISAANFTLYILLARWLAPADYGVFAVVFSIYMFVLSLHSGLIQEPMSVLGHIEYKDAIFEYCPRLLRLHFLVCAPVSLSVALAGLWFFEFSRSGPARQMGGAFLSLAFCLPFLLLLWVARRMAYMLLMPYQAAISAFLYCCTLLVSISAIGITGHLTNTAVFGVMALASVLAGVGLLRRVGAFRACHGGGVYDALCRHIHFGKWLVAVAFLGWLARDVYYVLALGLIGPVETGALRAAGNLVTPLEQGQTALSIMLLPWLSSLSSRGETSRLRIRAMQVTAAFTFLAGIYFVIMWPASAPLMRLAYRGRYDGIAWMVPWLMLPQVFRALSIGALLYLMTRQKTKYVFYAALGAGAPALPAAVAMRWHPIPALMCGIVLSGLASFVLAMIFYNREILTEDRSI